MQNTLDYYDKNAREFAAGTAEVDFSQMQNRFLELLTPGARILDFGCGSGRDTKYFLKRGFRAEAVDGSEKLCRLASEYTGIRVKKLLFQELDETERYDGIWACASILHLKRREFPDVISRICRALKTGGILYASFKYGDFEGERNGRYFTDLTEDSAADLFRCEPKLRREQCWVTADVREGRNEERWLNLLFRKVDSEAV